MPTKKAKVTTKSGKLQKAVEKIKSQAEIILALSALVPIHAGQQVVDDQLFIHKKKRVFIQCGRNWGKTTYIAKAAVKFASLNPNSRCYIILPEKEQGKEILWSSGVLRGMIPDDSIKRDTSGREIGVLKNELRIILTNGSFVKILGADDPDSLRGIKPHFCAYDEYRDFKQAVYWGMEANLLGNDATLLIGSTPPDVLGHYSSLREYFLAESVKPDSMYYYLELPTETNPFINKETLFAIKRRLIAHGQLRVWEREYMAKFIPGGASSIFPMFADKKEDIVRPSALIDQLIKADAHLYEFYAMFDPATSSVFAVLLIALNRYTGQVIVLDEIYERDRKKTGSHDIWLRANILKSIYMRDLGKWENRYDEHESWFFRDLERYEVLSFSESIDPTNKQSRNKEEDLGILKDLMLLENRFFISDKCVNYIEEIESYATDEKGKIPKKKDHQIDNTRYFLEASGFMLNEQPNYEEFLQKQEQRGSSVPGFEQFIKQRQKENDWTADMDESTVLTDDVVHLEDYYNDYF